METPTPTAKDGTPLKRIMFEGAEIWVLPHVDEADVIEKFEKRHQRVDWAAAGKLGEYGTISSKGYSRDY